MYTVDQERYCSVHEDACMVNEQSKNAIRSKEASFRKWKPYPIENRKEHKFWRKCKQAIRDAPHASA